MSSDVETLREIPLCAWLGCPHAADVQVEYRPGPPDAAMPPELGWEVGPEGGFVSLCESHAAELRDALGAGRVVALTRLR